MRTPQATPGRESIWEYPHPPIIEPIRRRIQVLHDRVCIADTTRALRICETGHPPSYYIPPEDVRLELLKTAPRKTFCEWKGVADYFDLFLRNDRIKEVAWMYPEPLRGFESIRDFLAFFAHRVDTCLVDGEQAVPEPRAYYGGWITSDIEGPFR